MLTEIYSRQRDRRLAAPRRLVRCRMAQDENEIEELRAASRDLRQRMQRLEARMHQLTEEHAAVVEALSRRREVDEAAS
jgi:hypothetical protein